MKIVHIRDAASVGENLVRILRDMGHQADHILPRENTSWNLIVKAATMVRRIPEAIQIGRSVRREGYDIVHLHVANAGWMATLGGYEYVVHCHGSEIRPGMQMPLRRQLAISTLLRAQRVLYVTPDLWQYIEPFRPDATLLPNPVDAEAFAPRPRERRDGPIRILVAVALQDVKRPDLAYEAIDLLRQRPGLPAFEVSGLGFGSTFDMYRHLLGTPNVTFLDRRPHDAMTQLYHDHDIIVGQLGLGALGMIELEAMACGKPIIADCDMDAYAAAYGEAPALISANGPEAIVDALEQLLRDADRRASLGRRAREWIVRHHGFEAIGRRLISVYESL